MSTPTTQTYTAVTIGPIYKTLHHVKSTKAVWAASYMFSWLVKNIVDRSKKQKIDIRLPDDTNTYNSIHGAGLYADRVYFVGDDTTQIKIETIISEIITDLANDIDENNPPADFLNAYFNIFFATIPFKNGDTGDAYPLKEMNKLLDHKELMENYPFVIEENPLIEYLEKNFKEKSILRTDAFGSKNQRQFRSIPEIATTSIQRKNIEKYDSALNKETDLITEPKKQMSTILPHQKYFAVLYADGDNVGNTLQNVQSDKDKLKGFSVALFEFGKRAEVTIEAYGGNGIYLGGEDILAFAPIACADENGIGLNTIFDLIEKLDTDFKNTLGAFSEEINKKLEENKKIIIPTLTYGIMLCYIKHPLKEAMKYAHDLMDDKAKKVVGKNSIAICLRKHSGQMVECIIEKGKTASYENLKTIVKALTDKENEDFLAGIMHRFNDDLFFDLFENAVDTDIDEKETTKKVRIKAFLDNFFNELVHKEKDAFIKAIKDFSINIFTEYKEKESRKNILFFTLRYIHFINSKNERN